jgi:hypothetical protein
VGGFSFAKPYKNTKNSINDGKNILIKARKYEGKKLFV